LRAPLPQLIRDYLDRLLGTHHTWTDGQLRAFEARWPLGSGQRLAYALLLFTGQFRRRCKDAPAGRFRRRYPCWAAKDRHRIIYPYSSSISRGHAGRTEQWNEPNRRSARTATYPSRACISNKTCRGRARAGMRPAWSRKAMTRRLAEGGATAKEIASVSGHKTLKEIERYTDKADQRRLSQAAMNKL
jgi:hypothetical protein